MTGLADDQRALLAALTRHGVEFVVIGGVAAQLHGWSGATVDLDIATSTSATNVERLNRALTAVDAGPGVPGAFGTAFQTRYGRLELIRKADGTGDYAAWLERAAQRDLGDGLVVTVADADDVLRSKEESGRDKDAAVLPQMRRDLIESESVSEGAARGRVASRAFSAAASPPAFAVRALGKRPAHPQAGPTWDLAFTLISEYRDRWRIDDPDEALGSRPDDGPQRRDSERLEAEVARLRRRIDRFAQTR